MILKALTLENFKGIREPVRIEFAPVTLLFGPNNAGKSTVVQALHYAREIFEHGNTDPGRTLLGGDVLDLGGFDILVHNHNRNLPIRIGFELDVSSENLGDIEKWTNNQGFGDAVFGDEFEIVQAVVEVEIRWSSFVGENGGPYIAQCDLSYGYVYKGSTSSNELLFRISSSVDGKNISFQVVDPRHMVLGWVRSEGERNSEDKEFTPLDEYNSPFSKTDLIPLKSKTVLPPSGRLLNFPDSTGRNDDNELGYNDVELLDNQVISSLTLAPISLVRKILGRFRYLSPFREMPERNHAPARSFDEFRWANGLAAWDLLILKGKSLEEQVNLWLTHEDLLNSGFRVKVKRFKELDINGPLMMALSGETALDDQEWIREALASLPEQHQLRIHDLQRDVELFPKDMGVGISQVVPVLVAAIHSQNGLVAIEEPESNIHPAFQVVLGDLFISQTREKSDLMFLVETHSEHLMLRFLRRIRETGENELPPGAPSLTPEGIAVYFVEPEEDGPRIHRIRIDRDGDFIDRWPRGFFQERMKELYGS